MTDRLDDLLKALPAASLDWSLDELEPAVWRRIEGQRGAAGSLGTLRFQLAAAGTALVIGLALGWTVSSTRNTQERQTPLYASYVEVGPLARLESGL